MKLHPYLFFQGKADEAIAFYQTALDAKLVMLLRFKDMPQSSPPPSGHPEAVMHARLEIGGAVLLLSDGHGSGGPNFADFALTLDVASAEQVDRLFAALTEGGGVVQAPQETFFSKQFAMARDRFGVTWIILVEQGAR